MSATGPSERLAAEALPAEPGASGSRSDTGETPPLETVAASEAEWRAFADTYLEEYFQWEPTAAVEAGRHELDGLLPDWSETGLRDRSAWLRRVRDTARAFDPRRLSTPSAFERAYLLSTVEGQLFWLDTADWPHVNPSFYVDALDPDIYVTRKYAPAEVRLRAFTEFARQFPLAAARIRANLRTPLPATYAAFGRTTFRGLAHFFENEAVEAFRHVGDHRALAACAEACAAATESCRELALWCQALEMEAAGEKSFAIGEPILAEMLRATESVDVDLARLERLGEAELERNLEELREACARFRSGVTLGECVATVRSRKAEGGVLAAARRQVARLERFVRQEGVVTIPDHPAVEVEESPPYMRWNSAYIRIPGAYDAYLPSTYYITPPNPAWTAEERSGYVPGRADLLFASVHEVWPGHFLQFLHSHRAPWQLGRVFVSYGFAEGWAHYAEELVWELGLDAEDPEAHVAKALNSLARTARYLAAIRLHCGTMSVAEAEAFFRKSAFLDTAGARQQAARGTFDPGYLNYTLGKLVIRKLRGDWEATREAPGNLREFHDRLLSYGAPPLALVREALLGPDSGPPL